MVYSLAWGDQPALICEHVDWARAAGFKVVCAGKGTRYHPKFHQSTPDTVWDYFHFGKDIAERGGMNPKMFNSFIDGTKSGIEMTA
ncbi:MAG: flagellar biosynthesis protein FlgA, partial [Gammaproteobacteria bacterium]